MWGTALLQRGFSRTKVIWAFRCQSLAEVRLHQTFAQVANTSVGPHNANSPVTQESTRKCDSFTWSALRSPDQTRAVDWGLDACGCVCQICHWKTPVRQARGTSPEDTQHGLVLTQSRWCALLSTGHWSDEQAVFQLAVTITSGNSLLHCLRKGNPQNTLLKGKKSVMRQGKLSAPTSPMKGYSALNQLDNWVYSKVKLLKKTTSSWSKRKGGNGVWGDGKYIFFFLLKEGGKGSLSLACM